MRSFAYLFTDWHCGDDMGHIRLRRRPRQFGIERTEGPAGGSDRYKLPRSARLLLGAAHQRPHQQQRVHNLAELVVDSGANHTGRPRAVFDPQAAAHAVDEEPSSRRG